MIIIGYRKLSTAFILLTNQTLGGRDRRPEHAGETSRLMGTNRHSFVLPQIIFDKA